MSREKASSFFWGSAATYFEVISKKPLMPPEEEVRIAGLFFETKEQKLADQLVEANLRFVVKVALEYRNYGFQLLDLIQEGNAGLVRALKSFNPSKGFRLISYAVWWIRAFIQEYILKNWSLVKIGTTQLQRRIFNNLQSSKKRAKIMQGVENEAEYRQKVADYVGGTEEDVGEMQRRINGRDFSLDAPVKHGDESSQMLYEVFSTSTDGASLVETEFMDHEQAWIREFNLANALDLLEEREARIVSLRHLNPTKNLTLRELGKMLGISKERVRQLEKRALQTLHLALGSLEKAEGEVIDWSAGGYTYSTEFLEEDEEPEVVQSSPEVKLNPPVAPVEQPVLRLVEPVPITPVVEEPVVVSLLQAKPAKPSLTVQQKLLVRQLRVGMIHLSPSQRSRIVSDLLESEV